MALPLDDRIGLPVEERRDLERLLAAQGDLADVIRWALAAGHAVAEVVVQDEFTHDVVVAWSAGRYLVYDTT